MLWTDGSVLFSFGKDGSGVLANSFLALRPPFSFQQAQYVQVSLLKPAPFCKLFAGLSNTWKSATSLFLLSDCGSLLATPFSPSSFLLLPLLQELSSLSSCSIRLQWVSAHSFLPGNDAADELARRGALLVSSAIPCSLSCLIFRIHPHLFFRLEAYCLVKILRPTGSLDFHRGTCAPLSRSLCSISSMLQRTQPTVELLLI